MTLTCTESAPFKPRRQIAAEVAEFITSTPDVELWADYSAYDHVVLAPLFGRMIDLPDGVPMWTHDLRQEWDRLGRPGLPSLPGITEHNALDDARECQYRRRWLASYATRPAGVGGSSGTSTFDGDQVTVVAPGGSGGAGGSLRDLGDVQVVAGDTYTRVIPAR